MEYEGRTAGSVSRRFHVDDDVRKRGTFLDDVKKWSGPFFDAHQLCVMSNFDVDVIVLTSTAPM